MEKTITKIHITSRGKNRDVYGNPYYAFRVHVTFNNGEQTTLCEPMDWGDSTEKDCYNKAMDKIKKTLQGVEISKNTIITHDHTRVSRDSQLEHPERWRV